MLINYQLNTFTHYNKQLNMEVESNPPSLTRWEEVKMVGPVVVFSIILPFTDIVTDLQLIIKLFSHGHVNYASMLLGKNSPKNPLILFIIFLKSFLSVPFLANYFVSFLTWYRLEKNKKRIRFLIPLLNLYPIYGKYQTWFCLNHEP